MARRPSGREVNLPRTFERRGAYRLASSPKPEGYYVVRGSKSEFIDIEALGDATGVGQGVRLRRMLAASFPRQ